jgi:hypothetical protein
MPLCRIPPLQRVLRVSCEVKRWQLGDLDMLGGSRGAQQLDLERPPAHNAGSATAFKLLRVRDEGTRTAS